MPVPAACCWAYPSVVLMSTRPGSTFAAMALASLGPDPPDEPELPLPELPLPEFPELPKAPPNGEPFPKGFPDPLPEPDGSRVLPEEGAEDRFELFVAAWPMATPPARRANAATPARMPLRTWWAPPAGVPGAAGMAHTGAPGSVGGPA